MNYSLLAKQGVRNGGLTLLYIGLVVTFFQNATRVFGEQDVPYLTGFMGITLFVVSALVTSSLVLWQPLKLLVDGKKEEAGALLCITGATLVGVLILAAVVALVIR